ncbi:hypothetical protein FGRMN_7140 [Fusarium graminum]|nr:hypothetical protein FGRMN_7140 [Fusarium graminum]
MSLSPPPISSSRSSARPIERKEKRRETARFERLRPEQYANAVLQYSRLPTGAGQNHIALGQYLSTNIPTTVVQIGPGKEFVTLYPLAGAQSSSRSTSQSPGPSSDADADEPPDEKRHQTLVPVTFTNPNEIYNYNLNKTPQSCIVFLRGFMTAQWINHVGARYVVDPELFSRHLDFSPPHNVANNFSIPALPSSCGHLIELPIMTIRKCLPPAEPLSLVQIDELRGLGATELAAHHHRIAKLASSEMSLGDSMVRNIYVFDDIHSVIEQRLSLCMQPSKRMKKDKQDSQTFTYAGADFTPSPTSPWSVNTPVSWFLPVIRHKPMVALKSHLFTASSIDGADFSAAHIQSLSSLPEDYGRSLRPSIMAKDPFYSMTEMFNFSASSQIQFLNLIDTKLDMYSSGPTAREPDSLQHLKYFKVILYGHIQKTKGILESIRNAQLPSWPTDPKNKNKTSVSARTIEQDFAYILDRTTILHTRVTESISVLMSSMSIWESQRAILQAKSVGKLTFLAFIFVPLSFTTSFFGMSVNQIEKGNLDIWWWVVMSVPIVALVFVLYFIDMASLWLKGKGWFRGILFSLPHIPTT